MTTTRQPVVFLPHGGGPWPFVKLGFGTDAENAALRSYLESVSALPKTPPKAVLVVSAHWEERVPTLMTSAQPPLLFDYYGFPEESYRLTWPAPGAPELAPRVQALLKAAGFETATDDARGFDHGTFVPLKLAWPQPNVPTLQLSLKQGLDPAEHLAMGRALAPLRDEGVFLIGSGMTFHNMRGFMNPSALPVSQAFDAWLQAAMQQPQDERDRRLTAWASAPAARQSHPREEHLLPAMVCAGAAMGDVGRVAYAAQYAGVALSAYHFG
jgi:aromatic ring-opening dioxygenase catalytic subunit (LigB family)